MFFIPLRGKPADWPCEQLGLMEFDSTDSFYMQRAIALAELARGRTAPNPVVGCVVVKDGRILAEGYHRGCGQAHAERDALLKCVPAETVGSTVYVTLEPCCHQGRTPPCTDLILAHRVARVVIGCEDPNPLVAGKGIQQLQAAGVAVTVGVLAEACRRQNLFFHHFYRTGRPYVTQKYAMTLDGKIAAWTGDSKWVTGDCAREHVQQLRRDYAAILVGIGTVLEDDPLLTCRLDPEANPIRVILDRRLRLPADSRIAQTAAAVPTLAVCSADELADPSARARGELLAAAGIEILQQPGALDLPPLFETLGRRGIHSILIEGGAAIHGACLEARLADYAYVYLAPKFIGGQTAAGPIGGKGISRMADAVMLADVKTTPLGADWLMEGRPDFSRAGDL